MPIYHRILSCALVLALAVLAGCASPSDRPRSRGVEGGFSVLVDGPDHPSASRVIADIGAYAQSHGFARQAARPGPPVDPVTRESIPTAPERYLAGTIELEVSYQPATHRVSAYLHSPGPRGDRNVIERLYSDFDHEYGGRYGSPDPISESGFSDGSGGPGPLDRPPGASVPSSSGGMAGPGGPGDVPR